MVSEIWVLNLEGRSRCISFVSIGYETMTVIRAQACAKPWKCPFNYNMKVQDANGELHIWSGSMVISKSYALLQLGSRKKKRQSTWIVLIWYFSFQRSLFFLLRSCSSLDFGSSALFRCICYLSNVWCNVYTMCISPSHVGVVFVEFVVILTSSLI